VRLSFAGNGGVFPYSSRTNLYEYSLSTKGCAPGVYELKLTFDAWPGYEKKVAIRLK